MSYTPHTEDEIREMLARIGVSSTAELFANIPGSLRSRAELKLAPALDERALLRHMRGAAAQNRTVNNETSFLGAGAYHHFIPAAVGALAGRGEFTTAYTPYQAEISQGTLQAIFEFQSMICQLTGLDVANASLYDGASSIGEAALMAMRATRRRKICVSAGLHPHWLQVLRTYVEGIGTEIEILPLGDDGRTQACAPDEQVAAVILQSPNFRGCIEDVAAFSLAAHDSGALMVLGTSEALSLALLKSPGELGVDIACGEAQSFGVPLSFGGPYVGYMASVKKLVRQLPGRLIGQTVDAEGHRAFVLTLTTREQHIRREKATSNICTNQGLMMLRATIFLALLGKRGLRRMAEMNLSLSSYARSRFEAAGLHLIHSAPTFNEFVVEVPGLEQKLERCREQAIQPGTPLGDFETGAADHLLVCVTEMNSREEIDRLVRELAA
ncbi:MAG: aminomethyl-transferring glycine dehydrogenase subunit GcvPA [bacterium]|nr:aminomethyl-transferring glycine dehydrogenase subunit GcvPA [bacterium]